MNLRAEMVDARDQNYPTLGDYGGNFLNRWIKVTETGVEDYNFLILLHELIEQHLCFKRSIKEADITAFDIDFENKRQEGNFDDPGDDKRAPYYREHQFATAIERLVANELGVDWRDYGEDVREI